MKDGKLNEREKNTMRRALEILESIEKHERAQGWDFLAEDTGRARSIVWSKFINAC